jgi:hypothetical protein
LKERIMNLLPRILMLGFLLLLSPLATAGPDIVVDVEVVKGDFVPPNGVEVTFYVSFSNIGDEVCPDLFITQLWPEFTCSSCEPSGGCGNSYDIDVPELLPGAPPYVHSHMEVIQENILPYRYLVFADSVFNFCPEDNEDNNVACAEYYVKPVAGEADLVMESCTVEPSLEDASLMLFKAKVTNIGSSTSKGAVNIEFHLDKISEVCDDHFNEFGDGFALIPAGLEPDQSVEVETVIECPAANYEGACVANAFNELEEPDYQNNCAFTEPYTCVEAANNPDLEVISYSLDLSGDTPYFSGVMANNGTVDITEEDFFKIGIWFNKPGGPDINVCPDVAGGEGWVLPIISGLEKGTEADFGYASQPLPNGFYESWVVLDCDNEIFEMDEKNNRETDDLLIDEEGPDLNTKDAAHELQEVNKGFNVVYTIWVENAGSEPVDGFDVDIFWDVENAPTWQEAGEHDGFYERFKEVLQPGDVRQVAFTWNPQGGIPEGLYHTCVVLDITNEVYETNESNNVHCFDVDVPEYINGLPNLTIETFAVKPTGNTAHFNVQIRNTGVKPVTTPFRIELFSDQEGQPIMGDMGDLFMEVPDIDVDELVEWQVDIEDLADGEYRAYVIVDSSNQIEEAVEGDNLAGPRIYVICSSCDACPEGVYITNPGGCYCGGSTANYGFCCNDAWYAVGCPGDPIEVESDTIEAEPSIVEFGNGGFGTPGEDCGCRMTPPDPRSSSGIALLLLLSSLLLGFLRRQGCDRVAR